MVDTTKKTEQKPAKLTQQEKEDALKAFMLSASDTFDKVNGLMESKPFVSTIVIFNMWGIPYECMKRENPDGTRVLWVSE